MNSESPSSSSSASITVAVRVRPLLSSESSESPTESLNHLSVSLPSWNPDRVVKVLDQNTVVFDPVDPNSSKQQRRYTHGSRRHKEVRYGFDRVFHESATQQQVYDGTALHLISDVLNGYNATVFAYGATGCGKTHTITGTLEDPGIIFRAMRSLFERMDELSASQDKIFQASVSFLEVYNETIWDLLADASAPPLDLREDESRVLVAGLSEHHPENVEQVMDLLLRGNGNRKKAPTAANSVSSRSHAVLQVHIKQRDRLASTSLTIRSGTLSIIDLAGSERASVTKNRGERLLEGANINRSLLALGNCFNALCSGKTNHIPYRDSKLTRLLKYSLGGNCKVVMIANISPAAVHFEETHNTLKYANRAKNIRTKVTQNENELLAHVSLYPTIIKQLQSEVDQLKTQLQQAERIKPQLSSTTGDALSSVAMQLLQKCNKTTESYEVAWKKEIKFKLALARNERQIGMLRNILVHLSRLQNPDNTLNQVASDCVSLVSAELDKLHLVNATLLHNMFEIQVTLGKYRSQMMSLTSLDGSSSTSKHSFASLPPNERQRILLETSVLNSSMETRIASQERDEYLKVTTTTSQIETSLIKPAFDIFSSTGTSQTSQQLTLFVQELLSHIIGAPATFEDGSTVDHKQKENVVQDAMGQNELLDVYDDVTEASESVADTSSQISQDDAGDIELPNVFDQSVSTAFSSTTTTPRAIRHFGNDIPAVDASLVSQTSTQSRKSITESTELSDDGTPKVSKIYAGRVAPSTNGRITAQARRVENLMSTPDEGKVSMGPQRITPLRRDQRRKVRQSLIPIFKAATAPRQASLSRGVYHGKDSETPALFSSPNRGHHVNDTDLFPQTPGSPTADPMMLDSIKAMDKKRQQNKENVPSLTSRKNKGADLLGTPSHTMSLRTRRQTAAVADTSVKPPAVPCRTYPAKTYSRTRTTSRK